MTTARIDEAAETLVIAGAGQRPTTAELIGPRARVDARVTGGGKTWKATFPLRASRWGGPELPLPTGDYELRIACLLYTSPSPRDVEESRMPSSA